MEQESYVQKIYNELHAIPEVGSQEVKTSKFIANQLRNFGYKVEEKIGGTGIIGILDSKKEGTNLGVRADMDALEFDIEGKKTKIHACGHDANSAMVLSAAKAVAHRGIKSGKIVFIFQPAEETLYGAKAMCKSGKLDDIQEMIGIHLRPQQEAKLGQATPALCHGASASMKVEIQGLAAHGARPHLGVNVIDGAVEAIGAIHAIQADPRVSHSIKVTKIQTQGSAYNIIPDRLNMVLDIRAQTNEVMEEILKKAENAICKGAESVGAKAVIKECSGVVAAQYDDKMVQVAKEAIKEVLGAVLDPIMTPGGEDFHFYTKELNVKTAYVGLGANLTPGLHHPQMQFDHKALEYGKDIIEKIVFKRLG